jgi:hypothetical protein
LGLCATRPSIETCLIDDSGDRARFKITANLARGDENRTVCYSDGHDPLDESVYNRANIDGSKVVWAREMDVANNLELIRCYGDRKVWLARAAAEQKEPQAGLLHGQHGAATQPQRWIT